MALQDTEKKDELKAGGGSTDKLSVTMTDGQLLQTKVTFQPPEVGGGGRTQCSGLLVWN